MSFIGLTSDELLAADDLPERLGATLREGFRGGGARLRMSPGLSYGRHAGPAPYDARPAAVTILLYQRDGRWHLPLTERPAALSRHGGQVSLPGGSIDAGESSQQAALRELSEELGIDSGVELVGRLAECYIYASNFVVTPWIAVTRRELVWKPYDREVQRIIELPLEKLFDNAIVDETVINRGPLHFGAPCISIHDACVWGATAVILGELAEAIKCLTQRR
jgi:8-oxo-dGTP pyrophosphatase MutT (NUDIX family)